MTADPSAAASGLRDRFRAFALPRGPDVVASARGVRLSQRGELVLSPGARPIRFTAEQTIDALRSAFRWVATVRLGPLTLMTATDAYEDGRGSLVVRALGLVPVMKGAGADFDRGELQRYLGEVPCCPPALVLHPTLEWSAIGADTARLRDRADPGGATVDLALDEARGAVTCRADRPRAVGKGTVTTPWEAVSDVPHEWSGMRVPTRIEVAWQLPEGRFTYFRAEITALEVVR
ncbi:DUF6920 family protein [Anaeromyxobacter oryzae]|uniref:Uncharacterized protein n=1 Tax=Anaeromyxobacter oryzae TaxID=2918170 RepID=A0ABN6MM96_9BACT|nr:DUF6544 family protein [Anaeromyxobacter oryzae]BDG02151.1 hypothetical protein AMOR_11470 [Anaeromyxobacter oryzae]